MAKDSCAPTGAMLQHSGERGKRNRILQGPLGAPLWGEYCGVGDEAGILAAGDSAGGGSAPVHFAATERSEKHGGGG